MSHHIRHPKWVAKRDAPNDYHYRPGAHVDALWQDMEREKQLVHTFEQMKLLRQMQRQ